MKLGIDFQSYVQLVCQYAFLEYDFGIESNFALFQLSQEAVEYLGACWISCVSVPDASNYIASKIKQDMSFFEPETE